MISLIYEGYWLCRKIDSSQFLQVYQGLGSLYENVRFHILSFQECQLLLKREIADFHIIIMELSSEDNPDTWFPLISDLSSTYPHLKIIFILTGNAEHNFYYLNQIPFTYLIPENQAENLLQTGIDKAVRELDYYKSFRPLVRISAEPALLPAVYFSTDDLTNKGKRGCHIHYPGGKTEYTRLSLKNILSKLPANFVQVHKSYVVNMRYFGCYTQKPRPRGNFYDEYITLIGAGYPQEIYIPVGPKYRNFILDFIMDKYTCSFLPDPEGKEAEK